ncbi:MAG: ABC transporter substrate-binding protein [Bdellovibrionales bacterium]
MAKKELRVFLPFRPPVDPLFLKSMAEYDCSLLLYRTWLNYDFSRKATPGIVKSWAYNEKSGIYLLTLDPQKWSDGSTITSHHLAQNLERVFKSKTTFGKALAKIIDRKSIATPSPETLSFKTVDGRPSESLFNQLGSIFLALIHPDDLDKTKTRLVGNTKSSGPYVIDSETDKVVTFKKNPHFKSENPDSPDVIVANIQDQKVNLIDFLKGKTWSNYYQTNSFVSAELGRAIRDSGLPIWTRGADRVMLMRPLGKGEKLKRNQHITQILGSLIKTAKINHPLDVKIAKSLQPNGYPLFGDIEFDSVKPTKEKTKISILTMAEASTKVAEDLVNELAAKAGIDVEWRAIPSTDFLTRDWESFGADYALFSFGVADPEPTTWLGLVFGSKLIQYSPTEKKKYEKIAGISDQGEQVAQYRDLLRSIAMRGGYLPLMHGATISIGAKGMSFERVDPLDETVDYSKIRMNVQ